MGIPMKNHFVYFVFLTSFISLPSWSQFVIEDQNHIIEDLAQFNPGLNFSNQNMCGKKEAFKYSVKFCKFECSVYCLSQCEHPVNAVENFNMTMDECTADRFFMFSDDTRSLNFEINKSDYESAGNYWYPQFLKNLNYFLLPSSGKIYLKMKFPNSGYYISEEGRKKVISVHVIYGDIEFAPGTSLVSFELWVTNDLEPVRQILMFKVGMSDSFYQLRGFVTR